MALRFTPKFTENDIRNFVRKRVDALESVVLDQLKICGEQFVADARQTNTYKDRTRNLRGSIGYVIVKDGIEIFGNFDGEQTGQENARQLIKRVYAEYPRGFVLVVVAGMEYAAYVESKGYDVITGSSQVAESNINSAFNRLQEQLKKVA